MVKCTAYIWKNGYQGKFNFNFSHFCPLPLQLQCPEYGWSCHPKPGASGREARRIPELSGIPIVCRLQRVFIITSSYTLSLPHSDGVSHWLPMLPDCVSVKSRLWRYSHLTGFFMNLEFCLGSRTRRFLIPFICAAVVMYINVIYPASWYVLATCP